MSIKPQYSQAILCGEKTIEFRRVFSEEAAQCRRVIIYESSPTMKIVGSFVVGRVDRGDDFDLGGKVAAEAIWENYCHWSTMGRDVVAGIDRGAFMAYMDGAKSPCAIYIKDVVKLENPFSPKEIDPNFRPPQSYMWCPEWIQDSVKRRIYKQSLGPDGVEALLRSVITGLTDDH